MRKWKVDMYKAFGYLGSYFLIPRFVEVVFSYWNNFRSKIMNLKLKNLFLKVFCTVFIGSARKISFCNWPFFYSPEMEKNQLNPKFFMWLSNISKLIMKAPFSMLLKFYEYLILPLEIIKKTLGKSFIERKSKMKFFIKDFFSKCD